MKRKDKNNAEVNKTVDIATIGDKKRTKRGGYSAIVIFIALAVLIAVNLIVGYLPSTATKIDVSRQQYYTISDTTKQILSDVDMDVTVYLIAESGKEDDTILELLGRYTSMSSHIIVKTIDPAQYPNFSSQYTDETIENNSVIVVSDKRSTVVPNSQIVKVDYSDSYYTGSYEMWFDGESEITSAINYVVSDNLPVMYTLVGHGEKQLSDSITSYINKQNIDIAEIDLIKNDFIPDDAECLMIYAPTTDISDAEAEKILRYMAEGGSLMLITDYLGSDMKNLSKVTESYGLAAVPGVVYDADGNHSYGQYLNYLLPNLEDHEITEAMTEGSLNVLLPMAHGIEKIENYRQTLEITPILTTSDSSYARTDLKSIDTMEKLAGDVDGPFNVAVAVEETYNKITSKVMWIASSYILDDATDLLVSGHDADFFIYSLNWMSEHSSEVPIISKGMSPMFLTMSSSTANMWFIIITIVIPVIVIVVGLVFWLRRRGK